MAGQEAAKWGSAVRRAGSEKTLLEWAVSELDTGEWE